MAAGEPTSVDPVPVPAAVFDGGDMDCGSGLILLIRENMLRVRPGEVLEMISREPTVAHELPPWCRMVGHEYLGCAAGESGTRYFLRRGTGGGVDDPAALEEDKVRAREFQFRLRARVTGALEAKVYARNFSWSVGQAVSFEERDTHPCALEQLLGAVAADAAACFTLACGRRGLVVEDVELTVKATLLDVLGHLGLSDGDPGLDFLELTCFVSTADREEAVREAWREGLTRSPLWRTIGKAARVKERLAFV